MVSERLRALRERIQRRETKVRASRRAKSRQKQMEERRKRADERARSRRVQRGEPEGAREEAQVTAKEARNLASDAKTLVSTELGVSRSEAEGVITQSADLVRDAGDRIDELDFDGDGDSDILTALDAEGDIGLVDGEGDDGIGIDPSEEMFDPFEEGPQ